MLTWNQYKKAQVVSPSGKIPQFDHLPGLLLMKTLLLAELQDQESHETTILLKTALETAIEAEYERGFKLSAANITQPVTVATFKNII